MLILKLDNVKVTKYILQPWMEYPKGHPLLLWQRASEGGAPCYYT